MFGFKKLTPEEEKVVVRDRRIEELEATLIRMTNERIERKKLARELKKEYEQLIEEKRKDK